MINIPISAELKEIASKYHYYEKFFCFLSGTSIAANSVVTKDIPPYNIAGGNPCRIIRKRFDEDLIIYLLELKWWDWEADKIFRNMGHCVAENYSKSNKYRTDVITREPVESQLAKGGNTFVKRSSK